MTIKARFGSGFAKKMGCFVFLMAPFALVFAASGVKQLTDGEAGRALVFLALALVSIGLPVVFIVTRYLKVVTLDADGISSALGGRHAWRDLRSVDTLLTRRTRRVNSFTLRFTSGSVDIFPHPMENADEVLRAIVEMEKRAYGQSRISADWYGGRI